MPTHSFTVIKCSPLHERYLQAFNNALNNAQSLDETDLPKIVFAGVKYITTHRYLDKDCIKREEIEQHFQFIDVVRQLLSLLTPNQFANLFPIEKTYDGEKYMVKDYFSTVEMLKNYEMDKPLGIKLDDFLWDYQNPTIGKFMVAMLSSASDLRKLDTGVGIMEEWAEKNDIETLTINEGSGYILNNKTHKTAPYKKSVPD